MAVEISLLNEERTLASALWPFKTTDSLIHQAPWKREENTQAAGSTQDTGSWKSDGGQMGLQGQVKKQEALEEEKKG